MTWLEKAANLFAEIGDRAGELQSTGLLGVAFLWQGDYDRAETYLDKVSSGFDELGSRNPRGPVLLGQIAWFKGNFAKVHIFFKEALQIASSMDDEYTIADVFRNLAFMAKIANDDGRAARLFGAFKSLVEANPELAVIMRAQAKKRPSSFETKLNTSIDEMFSNYQTKWEKEWSAGRAMTLDQAIAYVMESRFTGNEQ